MARNAELNGVLTYATRVTPDEGVLLEEVVKKAEELILVIESAAPEPSPQMLAAIVLVSKAAELVVDHMDENPRGI